jgi:predicted RNase H-like HicB family nuclease
MGRRPGGAYVPDLPGLITVADSRAEAERLIRQAVEFHLAGLREDGLSIPSPSSFAGEVDAARAACPALPDERMVGPVGFEPTTNGL